MAHGGILRRPIFARESEPAGGAGGSPEEINLSFAGNGET